MKIMTSRSSLAALLAVGVVTVTGCVSRGAYIESTLGESLAQTQASQTLNPEASLNLEPVVGLDGQSANRAITGYERSFTTRPLIRDFQVSPVGTSSGFGGGTGGGLGGGGTGVR